jgi:hypothetical protein
MKVQEKFRLDLNDEQAVQYFQEILEESVNALFPQFVEKVHQWAQYWRKWTLSLCLSLYLSLDMRFGEQYEFR